MLLLLDGAGLLGRALGGDLPLSRAAEEALAWAEAALLALAILAGVSALLWRYASARESPWPVVALVWVGWVLSFSVVVLLPIDVASEGTAIASARSRVPEILWTVLYWATFALCWALYPLLQSYSMAAEFHIVERVRTAIRENLVFYLVCGAVVGLLVLWIAVRRELRTFADFANVAMAAGNAWGLFLLMALLGHGLVRVPLAFWRRAATRGALRAAHFAAARFREELEEARRESDAALHLVRAYDDRVGEHDPFRPYVDAVAAACPPRYLHVVDTADVRPDLSSYTKLVKLNRRVRLTEHEVRRAETLYHAALREAFALEDVLAAAQRRGGPIEWTSAPSRLRLRAAAAAPRWVRAAAHAVEWAWWVHVRRRALQALALVCLAASLAVLWSEVVFNFVDTVDLSLPALLVDSSRGLEPWAIQLVVLLPIGYITTCVFYSLFNFRIFTYYRLLPHHLSDSNSILFSAAYLCRLTAPLGYNFLLMIHSEKTTAFGRVMGEMRIGEMLFIYFPIVLVAFVLASYFDLYSRVLRACCFERIARHVYREDISDARIEKGREIVRHERELYVERVRAPGGGRGRLGAGGAAAFAGGGAPVLATQPPTGLAASLQDADGGRALDLGRAAEGAGAGRSSGGDGRGRGMLARLLGRQSSLDQLSLLESRKAAAP